MAASIDYSQAFQLANKFEEYRLIKSWGIMIIVTGISIAVYRLWWFSFDLLWVFFRLDLQQAYPLVMIPLNLFGIGFAILPLILAITSYLAIKRTTVEDHEISSKRYLLYGITLVSFYFNNVLMLAIFAPYVSILLSSQGIVSSRAQMDVSNLIFGGVSCLISYLLLTRVVKRIKFKELLVPGVILILFSLISIILGITIPPLSPTSYPRTKALEISMLWMNTIIMVASFVGSGLFSIRKAYRILEGRE